MAKIQLYRPQIRRAIRGAIGPAVITGLEGMVARRSWAQTQQLGKKIGRLGARYYKRYCRLAYAHISRCFGDELTDEAIDEVIARCFDHQAMLFLEALRMPKMSREELAEVALIQGLEHVHAAIEQGHGAVMFSGHFGNWEIGAVRLIYEDIPLIPLSRPPRSPRLAKSVKKIRDSMGFPVIPVDQGVRGIMRALRSNQMVPIMSDRFAWGKGLTVPFFGHPTHVWHTPAIMAQRAECPILPCHAIRQPDGTYVVEIDPPVEQHASGDRDFDLWVNTARCMAVLEGKIRRDPGQYMWQYELWRKEAEYESPYPFEQLEGLV